MGILSGPYFKTNDFIDDNGRTAYFECNFNLNNPTTVNSTRVANITATVKFSGTSIQWFYSNITLYQYTYNAATGWQPNEVGSSARGIKYIGNNYISYTFNTNVSVDGNISIYFGLSGGIFYTNNVSGSKQYTGNNGGTFVPGNTSAPSFNNNNTEIKLCNADNYNGSTSADTKINNLIRAKCQMENYGTYGSSNSSFYRGGFTIYQRDESNNYIAINYNSLNKTYFPIGSEKSYNPTIQNDNNVLFALKPGTTYKLEYNCENNNSSGNRIEAYTVETSVNDVERPQIKELEPNKYIEISASESETTTVYTNSEHIYIKWTTIIGNIFNADVLPDPDNYFNRTFYDVDIYKNGLRVYTLKVVHQDSNKYENTEYNCIDIKDYITNISDSYKLKVSIKPYRYLCYQDPEFNSNSSSTKCEVYEGFNKESKEITIESDQASVFIKKPNTDTIVRGKVWINISQTNTPNWVKAKNIYVNVNNTFKPATKN